MCKRKISSKTYLLSLHSTNTERAINKLDRVFIDVCCLVEKLAVEGAKYFLIITNNATRKSWVYFLRTKDETTQRFDNWLALMKQEVNLVPKNVRSDPGGEFTGNAFQQLLNKNGIRYELTAPNTHQHVGVEERLNRTLVEKARCMLIESDMSEKFWGEAIRYANIIKNNIPTKALKTKTPEEA